MLRIWIALSVISLVACDRGAEPPLASPSAAPVASGSAPLPEAAPPAAAPVLTRKATPEGRRKADESACLAGGVEACRSMADRFRGYGHAGGCGIDRARPTQSIHGKGGSALHVRIKRTHEDTDADRSGFVHWMGKACDLGDAGACQLERAGRDSFWLAPTAEAEESSVRSDPSKSALWAWLKLSRPKDFPELEKERNRCLAARDECSYWTSKLYLRGDKPAPAELEPRWRDQLQAITESTLDWSTLWMMLDKNGYTPELLAPVREHATKVLIDACLEGACVCGEAARVLALDDPRMPDLARMGCENGEVEGCYALGRLYEEGRGVARDELAARSLYEMACPPMRPIGWHYSPRMGDYSPRACDRLAEIHEAGAMPPKDVARARYYAEFGCLRPGFQVDHAPCIRLARYWASGAITSDCVAVGEARCLSNSEEAEARFHGPTGWPASGGKECQRPSVKALCEQYKGELAAMRKPR